MIYFNTSNKIQKKYSMMLLIKFTNNKIKRAIKNKSNYTSEMIKIMFKNLSLLNTQINMKHSNKQITIWKYKKILMKQVKLQQKKHKQKKIKREKKKQNFIMNF